MAECKHSCTTTPVFPRTIENRPALDRIGYRIGTYASMRAAVLDRLNADTTLAAWTHRATDDPGIALLEATAIVGEILTFYQELYANEAFLRTADWRESVSELVQLLGYRLAPGVGGEATFALQIKGEAPVTVPGGFGLKAQLAGRSEADEFETTAQIIAYPALSRFHLYRPRSDPRIRSGSSRFLFDSAAGASLPWKPAEDDRLLAGTPHPGPADPKRIDDAEIVIVDNTWESFGDTHLAIKGSLRKTSVVDSITGYRLGRSFRHFGHTAPSHWVDVSGSTPQTKATSFKRNLDGDTGGDVVSPPLKDTELLVDSEVKDLSVGGTVVIQATLETSTQSSGKKKASAQGTQKKFDRTLVRKIVAVTQGTFTWGPLSGGVTRVELDEALPAQVQPPHGVTRVSAVDVRTMVIHEVTAGPVQLGAAPQPTSTSAGNKLYFYGTGSEHRGLMGRSLLLADPDGRLTGVTVTSIETGPPGDDHRTMMRRVDLSETVNYADFEIDDPRTTVYGNLVDATQGKSQEQVVLGSGDGRQRFQTFALPKPVTYLLDESQTPAQVPQLQIRVGGVRWRQVDTFFGSRPKDQVYVVREDDQGNSRVQFGDGKTGARLPSGRNNVLAVYRSGNGAVGVLEKDTKPQATAKLKQLDKVYLPGEVVGGDEPETRDNAREAAPGIMQSLGRLVGLADFEAEAMRIPGVLRARADWAAPDGTPLVRLVVLTASGSDEAVKKVEDTLATYNRCRGPSRFPVQVVPGHRQFVYLKIRIGYDASRSAADMAVAVTQALGIADGVGNDSGSNRGLFSLHERRFGQDVHRSQILGAVQQVDGVTWAQIDDAQTLHPDGPPATDPQDLAKPTVASPDAGVACPPTRILALHASHLDLGLAADEDRKEGS